MELKNTIKEWPKDDRPREKFLAIGANNLSNSELLAILIHNGTPERSALALAKDVLKLGNDDLNELGTISVKQLTAVKGIGEAKAVTIAAAMELGRRRQMGRMPEKQRFTTSKEMAVFLKERLKDYQHEVFAVIYLNRSNKILSFDIISTGELPERLQTPG